MPKIDLAWCCDDNYARHMGVALCSVLHNLSPDTQAIIYIVHSKLHKENKKNLESIVDTYHACAHFIEIDPEHLDGLKISHHITPAAYIRIALPDLLPQTVSKVLYLDCDLIAREDITPLATMEIGAFPLAAVPEGDQYSWCMNDLKHNAGIPHDAPYFNSGVLLLNLEMWRSQGLSKKILQFVRETPHRIRFHDQDAMNIFLHATYKHLDCRWNFTVQHLWRPETYSAEPISIIHFITGVKPWHDGCDHPMKGEYDKYLALTPWRAATPAKISAGKKRGEKIAQLAQQIRRKILSIYSARQALRSRTILCKNEIAGLSLRYALKSILINTGIVKTSRETLLAYTVRFFSYDIFVMLFNEIFIDSEYYFEATSTRPCIIDCCSTIGMAVLYFKRLYPYSHIIAFEPQDALFEILQENVQCNGLEDVELHNSAAAGHDGETELKYTDSSLLSGSKPLVDRGEGEQGSMRVSCVRLSAYIDGPVDFLKLDKPGYGHAILEELAQSGKLRLIKKMVIKHHHPMPGQPQGLIGILKILEQHGFGYQLRSESTGFSAGTGNFQTVTIFAYNETAG